MNAQRDKRNLVRRFLTSAKVRTILLCLSLSLVLWLFVTLGKSYQYTYSIPLTFVNSDQPNQHFYCNDSVVDVHLTSSGFDWLTSKMSLRRMNTLRVNVSSLSLDTKSGNAKIPTVFLNDKILNAIGVEKTPIEVMPDTLTLRWQKVYSKRVPVVSRAEVECRQPFALSKPAYLVESNVIVEGVREELEKIDTLFTEPSVIRNIDRNLLTFVPIAFDYENDKVHLAKSCVGLRVEVKEYTENTVSLPIEAVAGKDEKIRLFPPTVRLKYKVAVEDYKRVEPESITAYVLKGANEKRSKLRVMLNNLPDYIKVVGIEPTKVDYIIEK